MMRCGHVAQGMWHVNLIEASAPITNSILIAIGCWGLLSAYHDSEHRIPIWPSRATSLSNNRSDSRGDPTAAGRDPAREHAPSLSAVPFLSGPVRPPFFFGPVCCCRRGPLCVSSVHFFSPVYINENDTMCEKLSPVLVFLYVLIYDTIYVSHHVDLISLVLSFYILNLCKKDV